MSATVVHVWKLRGDSPVTGRPEHTEQGMLWRT